MLKTFVAVRVHRNAIKRTASTVIRLMITIHTGFQGAVHARLVPKSVEELTTKNGELGMPKKIKTETVIRVRAYDVMRQCVEDGVAYGWRKIHKYTDTPDEEAVKASIEDSVMSELCERFEFGDEF